MWTLKFNLFRGFSVQKNSILIRGWIFAIFVLFMINALSVNLGYGSPISSRIFGIISMLGIIVIYHKEIINVPKNSNSLKGIGLITASFLILLIPSQVEFWLISIPVFIYGFNIILKSVDVSIKELSSISLGCVVYIMAYIFYSFIPMIWTNVQSISLSFSYIAGWLVGAPLTLGASISGIWIFLTFFFVVMAFFILSHRDLNDWKILLLSIVGLLIVQLSYLLIHAVFWLTVEGTGYYHYILFLSLLVPFLIFAPRFSVNHEPTERLLPKPSDSPVLIIIFLIFLSISIFPYIYNGEMGKIVIYEKNSEMNFDIPQFPKENEYLRPYDDFSIGALGFYLKTMGYDVVEFNNNSTTFKDALDNANILIMINLNKSIPLDDRELIWNFVKNGGGLLIFGEHTGMFIDNDDLKSGKDYLNEVLMPTGIKVNFDTADLFPEGWKYAAVPLPHPVTRNLGFDVGTTSVGASLNLTGDAKPVIVGRYSFSDKANLTAPGHLGDRSYDIGERLGDIVIAASDTYGKGNVLVFGDTSYVFNSAVPFKYKLVDNSISWLLSHKSPFLAVIPWFSAIMIGFLALFYFFGMRASRNTAFFASISIVIALSLVVSGAINESLIKIPDKEKANIAWIDHAHINQFDLVGDTSGSIDGLIINLFRNGYMPLVARDKNDFSNISTGQVLIIIAPTKGYTSREVSKISDFVKNGGLLIISAGYDNRKPLEPLLLFFGMDIGRTPLGSPPWIVETHGPGAGIVTLDNLNKYWHKPKFMEVHPVEASGKYDQITWLKHEGTNYNLIITKDYGNGKEVLIGDARFLLNENLESPSPSLGEPKEQYQLQWLGNIELFRSIITKYKEGSK